MPHMCCVPKCNGNYATGPRVSTFAFPKDPELRKKWVQAVRKKNFSPTKHSRVCELHFNPQDIERVTKTYIEQTGELLTTPLKYPRLLRDTVPTKLPGSFYSASSSLPSDREGPLEKKPCIENQNQGLSTESEDIKPRSFSNLEELADKMKDMDLGNWVTVKKTTHIYFLYFDDTTVPKVLCFVAISENLDVSVFSGDVEIKSLSKYNVTFPVKVNSLSELEEILEQVVGSFINVNVDINRDITSSLSLVRDVLTSLVKKMPEKQHMLEFLSEQVSLVDKMKFE